MPAGDARSDLWFTYHLGRRIRAKLAASDDEMDRPVQHLTWDYPLVGPLDEPDADAVLAEINGWDATGQPLEQSWVAPEWGWAWPANRRILCNRAAGGLGADQVRGVRGRPRVRAGPEVHGETTAGPAGRQRRRRGLIPDRPQGFPEVASGAVLHSGRAMVRQSA